VKDPLVSVFIPTYLDKNDRYLQQCLWSLDQQEIPLDIIVITDRPTKPDVSIVKNHRVQLLELTERIRFSGKNNMAARAAHPASQFFLLLNDDAFPTRGMIKAMLESLQNMAQMQGDTSLVDTTMMGCLSNCDLGLLYYTNFVQALISPEGEKEWAQFPRQFTMDDVDSRMQELFEYRPFDKIFTFEVPRLYFYNVLIPRKLFEAVGPMEERFLNSCEDFDYCIRAKNIGAKLYVAQSAFCFHFGGSTADVTATDHEREWDQKLVTEKHGELYWRVI
jgi:GT2 family glycosyltransferase